MEEEADIYDGEFLNLFNEFLYLKNEFKLIPMKHGFKLISMNNFTLFLLNLYLVFCFLLLAPLMALRFCPA
jgi:hypothetical protein